MSDAMWLEGKEYISSKRASQLSGYAQDYIGQLARKGLIDAQRIGGLWFISMTSLTEYKSNADSYIPPQPEKKMTSEPDSLISFDGKDHISASRAATITGYHPDYVGQLARSGAIISRQVGNRWYIDREGILAHKKQKDGLLGALQSQSVGISRPRGVAAEAREGHYNGPGPFLTYTSDDGDLMPILQKSERTQEPQEVQSIMPEERPFIRENFIPIHVLQKAEIVRHSHAIKLSKPVIRLPRKTIHYGVFRGIATAALTVVIVLSLGFVTLKDSSLYGSNSTQGGVASARNMLTAGAAEALARAGEFLENILTKELTYRRAQ